jgi:hypothetical protein
MWKVKNLVLGNNGYLRPIFCVWTVYIGSSCDVIGFLGQTLPTPKQVISIYSTTHLGPPLDPLGLCPPILFLA